MMTLAATATRAETIVSSVRGHLVDTSPGLLLHVENTGFRSATQVYLWPDSRDRVLLETGTAIGLYVLARTDGSLSVTIVDYDCNDVGECVTDPSPEEVASLSRTVALTALARMADALAIEAA